MLFRFLIIPIALGAGPLLSQPIINEVHYGPEDKTTLTEFIELYNPKASSEDLSGWRISGAVDLTFPANTTLASGAYVLLAENPTALQTNFSIPAGTQVFQMTGLLNNTADIIRLRNPADLVIDEIDYQSGFPWPVAPAGEGPSMELISPSLDNSLGGSWRSSVGSPTPGQQNSVHNTVAPPALRKISHTPQQPTSSDPIVVKIKATDPDGIGNLSLSYQTVAPGDYLPAFLPNPIQTVRSSPTTPLSPNPAFEDPANWTTIAMTPSATEVDFFEATIPAQAHRTLVRYRITASDASGTSAQAPYPDDPSLNFSAFVYDGVPDYTGSQTYPSSLLTTLPVYQIITRPLDLEQCYAYSDLGYTGSDYQLPKGSDARRVFNWECAFVYDGIVYDHVKYRLRQNNNRYAANGKRSMRFRFNKGHYFQARDEEGKKWPVKWRTLNTGKMSSFNSSTNWGLREVANSRMWRMLGIECPYFYHIHFRVINDMDEHDRYLGDFFGMAMAFEDIDGRLLDARNLPDGNIYKWKDAESNPLALQRNQARYAVSDGSDFSENRSNLDATLSESELLTRVDWEQWSLYHAFCEAVRHYDFGTTSSHRKNMAWYFQPTAGSTHGRIRLIPHDHDASWSRGYHDTGSVGIGRDYPFEAIFGPIPISAADPDPSGINVTNLKPGINLLYRNVMRDFRDLFWQPDAIGGIIDDILAKIEPFTDPDRDRWLGGSAAAGAENGMPPPADTVSSMQAVAFDNDRVDGETLLGGRAAFLDLRATDAAIPTRPTISNAGPADFIPGQIVLQSSIFSDPQGAGSFAAMEWRIAEVNGSLGNESDLIVTGDIWKYNDTGTDLGTGWRTPAFDDSAWSSGPSELGYGEDEATTVSFGPVSTDKYPTTYFRKTFTLTPDPGKVYLGQVLADDGVAVYLNGQEIFRNLLKADAVYGDFADDNAAEDVYLDINLTHNDFVSGLNTLAVEIHNRNGGSSDISFDFRLKDWSAPPSGQARRFEWFADWTSGPLSSFASTIAPPASATRSGLTYRARVRHQDDTGRWSHWSDPLEFVAETPNVSLYTSSLAVSEFFATPEVPSTTEAAAGYNTADFEYLEVLNISSSPLDLTDIRFTKGVDYNFNSGTIAPGQRLVVAKNPTAYAERYPDRPTPLGPYTGKLKDEGERLKLSFGAGEPVRDFTYETSAPWPTATTTFSYKLNAPYSNPDHTLGHNWLPFQGLTTSPFTGSPSADLDGDGVPALVEHALGTSDLNANATAPIAFSPDFLTLSIEPNTAVDDALLTLEVSENLINWTPAETLGMVSSNTLLPSGQWKKTYQLNSPVGPKRFFRIQAISSPAP